MSFFCVADEARNWPCLMLLLFFLSISLAKSCLLVVPSSLVSVCVGLQPCALLIPMLILAQVDFEKSHPIKLFFHFVSFFLSFLFL